MNSPACRNLSQERPDLLPVNATVKQIKGYFAKRVEALVFSRGLFSAAWEDGVLDGNNNPLVIPPGETAYVNAWSNVWEWGNGGLLYKFANSGYKAIISHATHTYFDHPIEPDPEERGYYWATRFTDAFKTFSFVASDVYKNMDVTRFGEKLDVNKTCQDFGCPVLQRPENIAGIQGHIWQETMRTVENLHGNVFPRLLSLAEKAWHQADWESENDSQVRQQKIISDWQGFANRVGYRELRRLDNLGIKYDIRPPAVLANSGGLRIKTEYPGLRVEVSTDWGMTWTQYFPGMAVPDSNAIFVTKSADGNRRSRQMSYEAPQPPPSKASHNVLTMGTLISVTLVFIITMCH
jgi:hexosaminidase